MFVSGPELAIATTPRELNCKQTQMVSSVDWIVLCFMRWTYLKCAPDFVRERLAPDRLSAFARTRRISSLDHKPFDVPVKSHTSSASCPTNIDQILSDTGRRWLLCGGSQVSRGVGLVGRTCGRGNHRRLLVRRGRESSARKGEGELPSGLRLSWEGGGEGTDLGSLGHCFAEYLDLDLAVRSV